MSDGNEFAVPGGDTLPITQDGLDSPPYGSIVVVLTLHGVAEAFGPYGEDEAFEVAEFASRLVPTWKFDLDSHDLSRFGRAELDFPRRSTERPTRPRGWRDDSPKQADVPVVADPTKETG